MEARTVQKEQKNEVDNFTSVDIDILLMQNKSLMTELVRLKQASSDIEKIHEIETQGNLLLNEVHNRAKGSVSHFLQLFENFALKCANKWVYSLYEIVKENLCQFVELLDIGRNMKSTSFDLVYKFEELFRNNLGLFNSDYNKIDEGNGLDKAKEVDLLINRNSELAKDLKRLQDELEAIKQDSPDFKLVKDENDLLSWKNRILENRATFIMDFELNDINKALNSLDNNSFDLCYCGGKAFKALKNEIKAKMISKIPTTVTEEKTKIETKTDEESNIKVNLLKKELADLIEVAEKRRVDKVVVGKQILNSNFIYDIKQYLNDYYDYVKELEMRIETYNEYLMDIERERVKELESYKLKELKEKQRLNDIIHDLSKKVISLENHNEKSKAIKQETLTKNDNQDKINQLDVIVKNQALTIETLTSKIIKDLEEKVAENKKIISYLEKKLYTYKDQEILNPKYLDKDFRHSTHKRIFDKLYKAFESDTELTAQLKDMEKYIKAREEKIHSLEKKVKRSSDQLDAEQANSKALIQEIANSAIAFQKIQTIEEAQRNELQIAEENFNKLYKDRNDEKAYYERKIAELTKDIEANNTQLQNNLQTIKTLKQYVKQKDYEINDANRKVKELTSLLTSLSSEKDKLKADSDQKSTEIVILNSKIQAIESSVSKLSSQIADNLSIIAEKESVIKSVIASSRNTDGDAGDISTAQREEYFVNKLELKRLRDLMICKVCNVNEKNVVLSTCYHTFCEDCVQQKLKSRDRNCPVCMVKINKYDVQKLYLG